MYGVHHTLQDSNIPDGLWINIKSYLDLNLFSLAITIVIVVQNHKLRRKGSRHLQTTINQVVQTFRRGKGIRLGVSLKKDQDLVQVMHIRLLKVGHGVHPVVVSVYHYEERQNE